MTRVRSALVLVLLAVCPRAEAQQAPPRIGPIVAGIIGAVRGNGIGIDGIAPATAGMVQAHVIRMVPPFRPEEVSTPHYHDVEFQMVYVLKGWVKTYMEGQGETLMQQGSAWTQPPRIKHLILDYSDDVELLEVILPAEFKTTELSA